MNRAFRAISDAPPYDYMPIADDPYSGYADPLMRQHLRTVRKSLHLVDCSDLPLARAQQALVTWQQVDEVHSVPVPVRSELAIVKEFAQKFDEASALATEESKLAAEAKPKGLVSSRPVYVLKSMRVKREILRKLLKEGKTDEAVQMFEEARRMLLDFNATDLEND